MNLVCAVLWTQIQKLTEHYVNRDKSVWNNHILNSNINMVQINLVPTLCICLTSDDFFTFTFTIRSIFHFSFVFVNCQYFLHDKWNTAKRKLKNIVQCPFNIDVVEIISCTLARSNVSGVKKFQVLSIDYLRCT